MNRNEAELARDRGDLMLTWANDLTRACRLLFDAGATDEEAKIILDSMRVPSNPDAEWANRCRSWYAIEVEGA